MFKLRILATAASVATCALASGTAQAAPPTTAKVPAPFAGCSFVRGVTVDDRHSHQTGKGHQVHGNGWGYGHGCGDHGDDDNGGGGGDTIVS